MAQTLKEEVRLKIEQAALHEFYDKGYKFATMQRIASEAGIPTGLIYSYFTNKEDLFAHIVTPVISVMEAILAHQHHALETVDNLFDYELPRILDAINIYHIQVVILVDKSLGSRFVYMKEKVIDDVAEHIRNSPILKNTHYDQVFYHILATNFTEGVFEIARHYIDPAWAERMLRLLVTQHLYGCRALA